MQVKYLKKRCLAKIMAICPRCHSKNIIAEQRRVDEDQDSVSHLVMKSWLDPGGIRKKSGNYQTETVCRCEDCGHSWKPKSLARAGIAIIGGIILVCFIILEIVGK